MTDREARNRAGPQACFIRSCCVVAACGAILRRLSPPVLAQRAMSMVVVQPTTSMRLHLPASLRSTGITPLRRYYGCSDSCLRSGRQTGIPVSFAVPSVHSASNHPLPSRCVVWGFTTSGLPTTASCEMRRITLRDLASWASPFMGRLATATGRIEFAVADQSQPLLRTGRSPPVAPHPASRRRSYHRLPGARRPRRGLAPR